MKRKFLVERKHPFTIEFFIIKQKHYDGTNYPDLCNIRFVHLGQVSVIVKQDRKEDGEE
jgi:hypothetical protein